MEEKAGSTWVKPWLQKCSQCGMYDMLLREFCHQERDEYKKVLMITPETFDELLALIQNDICISIFVCARHHIPQTRPCITGTNEKVCLF